MLDFYSLDLTSITTLIFFSIICYFIIDNIYDESSKVDIKINILISFIVGILSSILISYLTLESDDLLSVNFWD